MKTANDFSRTYARGRYLTKTVLLGSSLALLPITAAVAQSLPPGLASPGSADIQQVVRQAITTNPEVKAAWNGVGGNGLTDRKSTRLNSSHVRISYAVFCLKKKKNNTAFVTNSAAYHAYASNLKP